MNQQTTPGPYADSKTGSPTPRRTGVRGAPPQPRLRIRLGLTSVRPLVGREHKGSGRCALILGPHKRGDSRIDFSLGRLSTI